jgi:hypothetical protein
MLKKARDASACDAIGPGYSSAGPSAQQGHKDFFMWSGGERLKQVAELFFVRGVRGAGPQSGVFGQNPLEVGLIRMSE